MSAPLLLLLAGALAVAVHLLRTDRGELLIDAAFVALLLARPSWAAAALLIVQYGARRVPPVARGLAGLWGRPVSALLLPGAEGVPPRDARPAPAPAVGPTIALPPAVPPAPPAQPAAPPPVPTHRWLEKLNRDETAPHLAVTGPTRSGKTTLVTAVLADRAGEIVICTPKPPSTDPWAGAQAVRLGEERGDITYAPLADAVRQVYGEMLRRNQADAQGLDPLTLVLDDYSTLVAERPEVRPWVLRMWTLGASCGIRVIIIDTEENVRAWSIEGRGEARGNLIFVRLSADRTATLYRWGEVPAPIDVDHVRRLFDGARLSARVWAGLSVWSSVRPSVAAEAPNEPPTVQTDGRTAAHQAKIALLAELRPRMSRAEARAYLATRGITFENGDWTEAGSPSALSAAS